MPKTSTSARQRSRRAKRKPRRPPVAPLPRAIEATLADIAHEIRTPLTGILALGELLATSELGERERGWATAIKSTAEHLALLTSLIVDAARADARGLVLRRELIRPSQLADAIAASLAARAEAKGLEDEAHISENLPAAVIGDPLRLRAALENLIDNAVKFTERGGVRLDVGSEPAGRGKVRLVFTVTDSGIGLTPVEIKRLFRPFAQANERVARRYGGAGLGLAFVKRVAKAMGGDLKVTSKKGTGSTFRLTALFKPAAGSAAAEPIDTRPAPARSLSILCAEDNPYGRLVMNTILRELGHRVDFVETGEAAVDAAARGGFDAILMDVTLSGVNGIEATRRIRALPGKAGQTPVIAVSGHTDRGDEQAARAAGMNFYFAKPVSPGKLAQVLANLAK